VRPEKKAERQRLGAQRDAAAGKPRLGCPRPFGWMEDRITLHPEESEAIREAARAILGEGTLSGVARAFGRRGLRPPQAPFGPLPPHRLSS
jgi:site-specific DNA recombinase